MPEQTDDAQLWRDSVLSILQGCENKSSNVKKLRKQVLMALQHDDDSKPHKKAFKKAVQHLESSGDISLNADGLVTFTKKGKRKSKHDKKERKEKKKKKRKKDETEEGESCAAPVVVDPTPSEEDPTVDASDRNKPCASNPQGVTRLFVGNLPFAVDETSLGSFLVDKVTHIKWITDKETGKFYGSAFVEMADSSSAGDAVAKAGQKLMGRPIKVNFAAARPGDLWPPEKKVVSGGSTASSVTTGRQAGGSGIRAMSAKPENCMKLFIGNLSYDIDDDAITKFFANVDAEVKAVRWLHHKDSGDFKGVGFVEFWNTEACEKGATLNGKNLLGRPIRIDWTD